MTTALTTTNLIPVQTLPEYKVAFLWELGSLPMSKELQEIARLIQKEKTYIEYYNSDGYTGSIATLHITECKKIIEQLEEKRSTLLRLKKSGIAEGIENFKNMIGRYNEELRTEKLFQMRNIHQKDAYEPYLKTITLKNGKKTKMTMFRRKKKVVDVRKRYLIVEKEISLEDIERIIKQCPRWERYYYIEQIEDVELLKVSNKLNSLIYHYYNQHPPSKKEIATVNNVRLFLEWLFKDVDFSDDRTYEEKVDEYAHHLLNTGDDWLHAIHKKQEERYVQNK